MTQNESHFRYKVLARDIEKKIKNGVYKPGEKLPSTRELHKKLNLSISTVYKAYIELEKKGLIEARPKSGYYVKLFTVENLTAFKTDADPPEGLSFSMLKQESDTPHRVAVPSFVNQALKAVNHPDYLHMGTAMISPKFLPFQELRKVLKDLTDREMESILGYSLPQGDPELRRQLSLRSLGIVDGINAKDYIITNGCTEAVSLALKAITKPGDIVAIESPTFYGFLPLLEDLDLMAVEIPTDPVTGVKIDALKDAVRKYPVKTCLLVPNFHNPLGSLMPDDNKRSLVEFLNRKEIPIIEDNINAELYYGKQRPIPLKAFDRKDLVIFCSSFSKTLAPGLRIGWTLPGKRFFNKVLKLKAGFSVSSSSLEQHLFSVFMVRGNYERYLRSLRIQIKQQVYQFADAINRLFPKQVRIYKPKGGILLWIELPEGVNGINIYQRALEKRISILPGTVFSTSGRFDNFIRIGCGFPFNDETEKGLAILSSIIEDNIK
ncbi:PLP-dependent aminotransferase family protein [bacterium]|nr:PLP-dependent aminotransferase family protein [bacterium]